MHLFRLLTLAALLCCSFPAGLAQAAKPNSSETMRRLLSLPAPTPRTTIFADPSAAKTPRPAKFYEKDNPPADDAPLEDLLDYWPRWIGDPNRPVASDVVKQRLLDACTDDIEKLPNYIYLFRTDEPTVKKVKELFDKGSSDQNISPGWLEQVKKWLVFNSKYFLNDLLALASKASDSRDGGSVQHAEALIALSRLNWESAESLVKTLAGSNQPRSSALAVSLLYQQAITTKDLDAEETYRTRLKTIVADQNAPARARDTAIETLSATDWSGRDDWYLSLLADASLREMTDGHVGFTPLRELFDRDPEKWIPVMVRLVESKDRTVQQNAASLLVMYGTDHPSRDVLLPVIRWLSNPEWLAFNSTRRAWFMQKMSAVDLPESVPGLIWIVENEEENRLWAALTLARYKDPRATPVLRKALEQSSEDYRRLILQELIPAGGIPDSEAIAALETYITGHPQAGIRFGLDRYVLDDSPQPLSGSIAKFLMIVREVPDSLAQALLARAESLKKTNPTVAQSLLGIGNQWRNREIELNMIRRIAAGTADAHTIATALERNAKLRENFGAELQSIVERSDEPLGIAAVLLNDPHLSEAILTSEKQQAQIALLVSARLTQTPLPVELVAKLLPSKNALLALAAERYLLAEDSLPARKLLWQHRPNQAFVTGWRENGPYIGADNLEPMGKTEEKLRAELFKEDGPSQIYALITNSERYGRVLRIYADKAIYTSYEDSARQRERMVSPAELASFKEFIVNSGLHDQGPTFGPCHHDCSTLEFVDLKKDRPWRIFSHQGLGGWIALNANFNLLGHGEGVKFRYELEKQIKGLEVLFADDELKVRDIWQCGEEIRILVEREFTDEELNQRWNLQSEDEEESDAAREERERKDAELENSRFSWRKLIDNKAGAVVAKPEIFAKSAENEFSFDDDDYLNPVVTPDGKWAVATKRQEDWSQPRHLIRRNLQTGKEFRVKLAPADDFSPIAFVALHNKVLLRRAKAPVDRPGRVVTGPDEPEYYLLDPATGATQLVTGEFYPLREEGSRFLQPTGRPHEFWAAIPDDEKNETEVGRYNLKEFSFKPVLTVPRIIFGSMSMWVDEGHDKLYIVYEKQLLKLPLKPAVNHHTFR
jgi:hypothetical protein